MDFTGFYWYSGVPLFSGRTGSLVVTGILSFTGIPEFLDITGLQAFRGSTGFIGLSVTGVPKVQPINT